MPGPSPLLGWPTPAITPPIFNNLSGIGHAISKLADDQALLYTEVDGYREHFADDDMQATRVFDVPWTQRDAFVAFMKGYSNTKLISDFRGSSTPRIQRVIPQQHPERPYLYVSRVEMLSVSGAYIQAPAVLAMDSTGSTPIVVDLAIQAQFARAGVAVPLGRPLALYMAAYRDSSTSKDGLARYAVTYTPRDYEIRTDLEIQNTWANQELARYVSREFSFAGSNLPFPQNSLAFALDPGVPAGIGGARIPTSGLFRVMGVKNCVYTWHEVPDIPENGIQTCLGAINSQAFDGLSGFPVFPAKTLMCHAPKVRRRRNVAGRVCWDITYYFTYRKITWDFFPAADGNFYRAVNMGADGKTLTATNPWPQADFNILFQVPPPVSYQ